LEPDDFRPGDLIGIQGGPLSDGNRPGHALVIVDTDDLKALAKADLYLPETGMIDERDGKPKDHRYYLVNVATIPSWAVSHAEQGSAAAKKATGHPGPFKKGFNHAETRDRIIDFIGTGGQVVCPGGGGKRRWVGGSPGEPAVVSFGDLWGCVCELAVAVGGKLPPVGVNGATSSSPPGDDVLERARAYLRQMGPCHPEAGHAMDASTHLLKAATSLRIGFELDEETAVRLLGEWDRDNPVTPYPEHELRRKCREALVANYGKPRGYLLDGDGHRPGRVLGGGPAGQTGPAADTPDWAKDTNLTDVGNGRRVIQEHGRDLHYCHPWKRWLPWGGKRWEEDETGEAVRRVKQTQTNLRRRAAAEIAALKESDDDRSKRELAALTKVLNHVLKWEDARRVGACLDMAKSEPGVPVLPSQLDADPFLLNFINGTVDLKSGQLREHRREDLITKLAPVQFDPEATCPLWERFLLRIMDGNQDLIGYLQRVVGYCLTGDVSEQCLWFFHGSGQNGKSTFLLTLLALLGDYACQAVAELLMVKKNEAHPSERADLCGKRLVATIETEEGKRLAEALMKQLTGGDKIRARWLFKDHFEFVPTHKLFLAANHKPTVRGTDLAVWRRIKLVPFTVTIPDEEKDKQLPEKLKAELPGILNWALLGCRDWLEHGLGEPDEVQQATNAYRASQDSVGAFLKECCVTLPQARIRANLLFETYSEWSGDEITTARQFGDNLRERGYRSERGHGGGYYWHGIGLPASSWVNQGEGNSEPF
jgi:putative DNA primase/helicase